MNNTTITPAGWWARIFMRGFAAASAVYLSTDVASTTGFLELGWKVHLGAVSAAVIAIHGQISKSSDMLLNNEMQEKTVALTVTETKGEANENSH